MNPSLREHAYNDRTPELYLPDKPISTPVKPSTSTVLSQPESVQNDRVTLLKDLRIGDASVGHVALDPTSTVPSGTSPTSTSNCLVVAKCVIPKSEVIHATLRTSTCLECSEYHISDSLRCQNIASHHCGILTRGEKRTSRNMYFHGGKTPLIQGNVDIN
uniref:Uncharacterized protein n=1 Tax=Opuntia streptacantha TaxID=393608 RepID=A0A7C9EUF9_OPUST